MKLFLSVLFIAAAHAFVTDPTEISSHDLTQEGRLFTIRLTPGEPIRIFVVGKEEAKFDAKELKLTIVRVEPYPARVLNATRHGPYYTIDEISGDESAALEIKASIRDTVETFRFNIKGQP